MSEQPPTGGEPPAENPTGPQSPAPQSPGPQSPAPPVGGQQPGPPPQERLPTGPVYPARPPQGASTSNGMAVAALVLGILSLPLAIVFFPLGILLGLLAIIFGAIGRSRAEARGRGGIAIAGLLTGLLGVLLSAAILVLVGTVIQRCLNDTSKCFDFKFGSMSRMTDDAGPTARDRPSRSDAPPVTLDGKSASRSIVNRLLAKVPEIGRATVTCPRQIEAGAGKTFHCKVTGGAEGTITAKETDDAGHFTFSYNVDLTR